MSWRDSDDPRCPNCGGKITATATYCMHCEVDLVDDDTGEVLADDEFGAGDGEVLTDDEYGGVDRGQNTVSDQVQAAAQEQTSSGGWSGEKRKASESQGDRFFERLADPLASMIWTDVPDPEGVPEGTFTAPLWMRLPIGSVSAVPVFAVFVINLVFLPDAFPGDLAFLLGLVGFVAIPAWLIRKPLPSDIVGDACYGTALLLLALPVVSLVGGLTAFALSLGDTERPLASIVTSSVGFGIFVIFPASFFLVVGYVGNRYARSKLDGKAEQATDPTNA